MSSKKTRRGFVMTGGGAKGLYEAGVIHAFHICGMEFDVITGSSIGAINAIVYAEYLYQKRQLPETIQKDADAALEKMDSFVKKYHDTWLNLPTFQIVDDSETGPLGLLKNDLLHFDLKLPQVARLGWWWSDPTERKWTHASPRVWLTIVALLKEAVERLGSGREVLRIWGESRRTKRRFLDILLRAYLARFGLENALVPDSEGQRLVAAFGPIVDPQRTMRDFAEAGLDVRLTRANYRTGRLEISMYQSAESFLHYLSTHAWHLEQDWNRVAPLGSTRLQTAGNPNAIHAALASGRFPGVFAPFPVKEIYLDAPENRLTRLMLDSWLDSDEAEAALKVAYRKLHPTWNDETLEKRWQAAFATWRNSTVLRRLFPHHGDTYVDGGAIDNTPTNSAVDAMREWAARTNTSRRSFELDLYTVFLDPAQVPEFDAEERAPALYQVVQRTLALQSAATMPSDAVVVNTINTFGKRGEELGEQAAQLNAGLTAVLDGLDETLPDDMPDAERAAIEEALLAKMAAAMGLDGLTADKSKAKLRQIARRTNRLVNNYLPVHVNTVEIYPDSMPMGTLNFTERLGFRSENAIEMLTVGCYNTLWALRGYLENKRMQVEEDGGVLDSADSTALRLARKWMGFDDWPDEPATRHETWRCQRTQCAHYANACRHGRQQQP